jgi:flagellar assembly protein FliH
MEPYVLSDRTFDGQTGTTGRVMSLSAISIDNRDEDDTGKAVLVLTAAQQKAKELIDSAAQEVNRFKESVREEAYSEGFVKGRDDGQKQGYDAGFAEGLARAKGEIENQKDVLKTVIQQLSEPRPLLDEVQTDDILRFALAVAGKIVKTEILTNPRCIIENAVDALGRSQGVTRAVIRVNPRDIEFLTEAMSELKERSDDVNIVIQEDASIDRGGCILETQNGSVDARVGVKMREIANELLSDVIIDEV